MPTVTETFDLPDATTTRATVQLELVGENGTPIVGYYTAGDTTIVGKVVPTVVAGSWSATLISNALISPTGTRYKRTVGIPGHRTSVAYIDVPNGAGPYVFEDILDEAPGALTPPASRRLFIAGSLDAFDGAPADGYMYQPEAPALPVIIDTDWWTDAGDILALRAATSLERMGLLDIRAVTMNCTLINGVTSIDAMMVADGHRYCPIGKSNVSHVPSGSPPWQSNMANNNPHDLGTESVTATALTVMRQVLADADRAVDLLVIGYLNNVADLMNSPADGISPLTGLELIDAKVGTVWVMGGMYPSGTENNFNRTSLAKTSGHDVCLNWPGPIVFLGFEAGDYILSGGQLRTANATDIAAVGAGDQGKFYGRPSWDALAVWAATIGYADAGYTAVVGTNSVDASTGANTFTVDPAGLHRYLVKAETDEFYAQALAPLMYPTAAADTSETGVQVFRDGIWQAANGSVRARGAVSTRTLGTDDTLVQHLHAADLSDYTDGSTIAHWPSRTGLYSARQVTSANRPTFRTSVGSKLAVTFDGSNDHLITDAMDATPRDFTVYAYIYYASLPSAVQTIFSLDSLSDGGTHQPKVGQVRVSATNRPEALRFVDLAATVDTAAGAMSGATWTNVAMRFSGATNLIEVLVNGTGAGGTSVGAASYANSALAVPINIGGRYYDDANTNQFAGSLRELRFYNVRHSNAEVTAVVAAMV